MPKPIPVIPKLNHRYTVTWELGVDVLQRGLTAGPYRMTLMYHDQTIQFVSKLIKEGASAVGVVHEVVPADD